MPRSVKRSAYPAVTLLMTALVLMGGAVYVGRRMIPPPEPNRLVSASSDYLLQGANQDIDWWPLSSEAFAEARRLDRPIFLLISAKWSFAGRQADREAFDNQEVVERLRKDFLCIRVDAAEMPEWLSAYLPVRRAIIGFEPSFQVWVLDPRLRVFATALREDPRQKMDYVFMIDRMRQARERWLQIRGKGPTPYNPGNEQREDLTILTRGPVLDRIDFDRHLLSLQRGVSAFGGFPVNRFQAVRANCWRFLLMMGETEFLRASLDPVLLTPIVDWLDGGFFRLADGEDWKLIEFDKLARQNAEMMALLAKVWTRRQDPLYRHVAEQTYAALAGGFAADGLVRGYRIGDEGEDGRSARDSFPLAFLRGGWAESRFSVSERRWLAENLGLEPRANPRMIPYLPSREVFDHDRARLEGMLEQLREAKEDVPEQFGGDRQLDVNGYVAARILETGRLLASETMIRRGLDLADQLTRFRAGTDEVRHSLRSDAGEHKGLIDYLAYADAALHAYLCTGATRVFQDGLAVLRRGLELYLDEVGLPNASTYTGLQPIPEGIIAPNLCDDIIESSAAMTMRLLFAYGCIERGLDATRPSELLEQARNMMRRLGSAADAMGTRASGYFCAAKQIVQDRCAIVVGRDSVRLSRALSTMATTSVVAPLLVEPDDGVRPGIYIVRSSGLEGPLPPDDAARRLNDLMH